MQVVDLRAPEAFFFHHLKKSCNLPWPDLIERLNELPKPGNQLILVGYSYQIVMAKRFLTGKRYNILDEVLISNASYNSLDSSKPNQNLPLPLYETKQIRLSDADWTFNDASSEILWSPSNLIAYFSEHIGQTIASDSEPKSLDLGCGGGRDMVYLNLNGWQVTGIEHKKNVISRAEKLAFYSGCSHSIDFRCCNLKSPHCLPEVNNGFDLVYGVRFLDRSLFSRIKSLIKPGGYILWETFSEGCEVFGSPKNPNFILKKGELSEIFSDYQIILDRIESIEDGRPVAQFIARRLQ